MKFKKQRKLLMSFESTAMADIIFLLLIFFLLSSSFIMQVGTKVSLPKESNPETLDQHPIVITLEKDGRVLVNEDRVTMAELQGKLAEALESDPDRAVVVRGDESVSLGRTIEVMDIAKRLGAARLAIATRPVTAS